MIISKEMSKITDKVKEKLKDAKDKVASTTNESIGGGPSSSTGGQGRNEGFAGTESTRTKDPTKEYDEKEPMSPAKIKQHEPTAVRRDPSEVNIVEPGKQSTSSQDAAEKARRSGMTKGTTGAADTGSEYEQGEAGSNK
jgi:hypothetical protein